MTPCGQLQGGSGVGLHYSANSPMICRSVQSRVPEIVTGHCYNPPIICRRWHTKWHALIMLPTTVSFPQPITLTPWDPPCCGGAKFTRTNTHTPPSPPPQKNLPAPRSPVQRPPHVVAHYRRQLLRPELRVQRPNGPGAGAAAGPGQDLVPAGGSHQPQGVQVGGCIDAGAGVGGWHASESGGKVVVRSEARWGIEGFHHAFLFFSYISGGSLRGASGASLAHAGRTVRHDWPPSHRGGDGVPVPVTETHLKNSASSAGKLECSCCRAWAAAVPAATSTPSTQWGPRKACRKEKGGIISVVAEFVHTLQSRREMFGK